MIKLSEITLASIEVLNPCGHGFKQFKSTLEKFDFSDSANIYDIVESLGYSNILWYLGRVKKLDIIVKFAESAAKSAAKSAAAKYAGYAAEYAAESAAESAIYAGYAAIYAAESANYAANYAEYAAAESAAESAEYAAKSAAIYAAESANYAANYAAADYSAVVKELNKILTDLLLEVIV